MQKHIKNYFDSVGKDYTDFVSCEVCACPAVDIHHIKPRSKFGKKTKHLQDLPENLIALCRSCHDKAHSVKSFNEGLREYVNKRKNENIWKQITY